MFRLVNELKRMHQLDFFITKTSVFSTIDLAIKVPLTCYRIRLHSVTYYVDRFAAMISVLIESEEKKIVIFFSLNNLALIGFVHLISALKKKIIPN